MWSIEHLKQAKKFSWAQISLIFFLGTVVFPAVIYGAISLLSEVDEKGKLIFKYGIQDSPIEQLLKVISVLAIILAVMNIVYVFIMSVRKFD